eukprot:Hpha_TRINITY_DN16303_c2_g2::TRINITY_DN16303_c2_g2_i1::g.61744::m.61744
MVTPTLGDFRASRVCGTRAPTAKGFTNGAVTGGGGGAVTMRRRMRNGDYGPCSLYVTRGNVPPPRVSVDSIFIFMSIFYSPLDAWVGEENNSYSVNKFEWGDKWWGKALHSLHPPLLPPK